MSDKTITRLVLLAAAVLLLAGVPAHAEWTCNGTLITASSESTTHGSICANSYTATQSSNDVHECLRESTSDTLYHTWTFSNVPAGDLYLVYEGYRPAGDSDNFKFSGTYDEGGGPIGVIMTGAVISTGFELQGGIKYDMNVQTTNSATFSLVIRDTNASGGTQNNVYLDYLAICSEEGIGD